MKCLKRCPRGAWEVVDWDDIGACSEIWQGAMVRDTCESCISEIRGWRRARRGCGVWIKDFDRFIAGTADQLSVLCPGQAFDNAFMSLILPDFVSACQIPACNLWSALLYEIEDSLMRSIADKSRPTSSLEYTYVFGVGEAHALKENIKVRITYQTFTTPSPDPLANLSRDSGSFAIV